MYEPRVGDLVSVFGFQSARICRAKYGEGFVHTTEEDRYGGTVGRLWTRSNITPLRPDAPGQRVRARDATAQAGTIAALDHLGIGGCEWFRVRWDTGGRATIWTADNLIRIADQAPAAQVVPPCPETPADVGAAVYEFAPGSVQFVTGPTCQHCGSNVLAGLLRDTCPRGCDLTLRAKEPEPECVAAVWNGPGARDVLLCDSGPCPPGWERLWLAGGSGPDGTYADGEHPTREGAIAAWREAVRAR